MLLLDSGAQYECGTTDVTRTIHLGEPTEWQRECFTRVLHISNAYISDAYISDAYISDA